MTAGTGHLALVDRVSVGTMLVVARDPVTRGADVRLRRNFENRIARRVTAMTARAWHLIRRRRARVPRGANMCLMTSASHAVLHGRRCFRCHAETNDRLALLARRRLAHVRGTGS